MTKSKWIDINFAMTMTIAIIGITLLGLMRHAWLTERAELETLHQTELAAIVRGYEEMLEYQYYKGLYNSCTKILQTPIKCLRNISVAHAFDWYHDPATENGFQWPLPQIDKEEYKVPIPTPKPQEVY